MKLAFWYFSHDIHQQKKQIQKTRIYGLIRSKENK